MDRLLPEGWEGEELSYTNKHFSLKAKLKRWWDRWGNIDAWTRWKQRIEIERKQFSSCSVNTRGKGKRRGEASSEDVSTWSMPKKSANFFRPDVGKYQRMERE